MDPLVSFMLALVFAAAYVHVRVPSRRRPGGGLARSILAGGACLWLLYGLYELSVQREFKPENVPIRVDMLFIGPALVGLSILGVIAYLYGLASPKVASTPHNASVGQPKTAPGLGDTPTVDQANERLAHLLPKQKNGQKN
jgi:hypothetical protein